MVTPEFKLTEGSFMGDVLDWIREIIAEEKLPFESADQEMEAGKKFPDIIIWKTRRVTPILWLSLKTPHYDAWYDGEETRKKALNANSPYFATWNVNKFFAWETFKEGSLYDVLWYHKDVVSIKSIQEVTRVEKQVKEFLREFLLEFTKIYLEEKPLPLLNVDERFIARLRIAVDVFSIPMFDKIKDEIQKNPNFTKELRAWFTEQGWTYTGKDDDIERTARQCIYLLIDKTLFYNALKVHHPQLPNIQIDIGLKGEHIKKRLQGYFDMALGVNYETIFLTNFLEKVPLPDEIVESVRTFCNDISRFDFSKIGFEVIGRVFERLIPEEERHKMGQYFTSSDIVDLINSFCIRDANTVVLDPACGGGTFLVRAYALKKYLEQSRSHKDLIKDIYGVDIAKFPAHLTTMNLCMMDLSEKENYPNVFWKDFFYLSPHSKATIVQEKYVKKGWKKTEIEGAIPMCDAVVLNPPYTRQEEMEDILTGTKQDYRRVCIDDWKKLNYSYPTISKRSSIYLYFFLHSGAFIKNGGRIGLITSNSWLDVKFGGALQRFLLENFKVVAIIESRVERWFEDADVNTAITILERCNLSEERDNNIVRFVQLKKPLKDLISRTEKIKVRFNSIAKLVKGIMDVKKSRDDETMRVFSKTQKELWDEGFNEEKGYYEGAKWGKYIRAPDIFFKILERKKELFAPLKKVAKVRRGFTTGANEFFYLTEEEIRKWGIEKEFWMHKENGSWVPNYIIKSPRESKGIIVKTEDVKYRVLMIHKDKKDLSGTNILKYIKWGEEQEFNKRPTCASRRRWWELPKLPRADVLFRQFFNVIFNFPLKLDETPTDHTFYYLCLKNKKHSKIVSSFLNSTVYNMIVEIFGRTVMGQGVLINYGPEIKPIPIINLSKLTKTHIKQLEDSFDKISQRQIGSVFEEIGANSPEDVSLNKVKPDRRELDKIVMGEILGLSEKEQLEVYRAVVDLVKTRVEKAKTVERKKKSKKIDVDALVNSALAEVGELKVFPEDYIKEYKGGLFERVVPGGKAKVLSTISGFYVDIEGKKIECNDMTEAKYICYAARSGKTKIKMPMDAKILKQLVKEYAKVLRKTKKRINEFLENIPDKKLCVKIRNEVWKKLGIYEEM